MADRRRPMRPVAPVPSADLPLVAIVGRPNVGKSTLFNRLVGRRQALVADTPGVTRDRKEGLALLRGRTIRLVDTAGLEEAAPTSLFGRMRASSESAVREAVLVLFCIDARAGITPADEHFAAWVRKQGRPVLLVANKAEGRGGAASAMEAYSLGLGEPVAVSAEHGEGLSDLMGEIVEHLPPEPEAEFEEEEDEFEADAEPQDPDAEIVLPARPAGPIRIAIVGRPNAGKSTLLNALLGEERMITGPEPGLTRDSVAVTLHDEGDVFEVVDTAGLRRKARIDEALEKMSVSASIEALKMAEVAVLVLDATLGVHEQDLQIARLIEREGRACVLALNKWDAVEDRNATRQAILDRLSISLAQMRGVPVVTFSALTGASIHRLLPAVREACAVWNARVPTGELNRWFEDALERHAAPLVEGRRLKLRYMTQVKSRPPTFVIFGTRAEQTPEDYKRYLVNGLRETFNLPGVPIRLQTRGTKNPYNTKSRS
ncbi:MULTISPECIES: ribosome biogenesis GTPase Der [Acetobacter]|uniref:GTPase Der n=2 Tax=Acetobacter cerevisiae TaxID=178900 RepID=A0ABT1EQD6_9PROT|nr:MULTISPECIES: ribosome biogenesis GTPase Der [Acetobacter]MCP1245587.1 ribosome biogenesis GTPase Der [Acetobacter cerevisiae]MCP1255267.1 ribosome biogenesis GTPase Der [Acetobacter cerevisiae]MCP1269738.1 ribosome biogenesis GTPase Der [Acetobacter cerevisiae]MCP1277692.1 ribosome biogenesis GTPase Der [Acetobacter cerevisiae]